MMKKSALGLIAVLVVAAVAFFLLWNNMDSLVKSAVETYGSRATQTKVELASAKLSLKAGEGKLSGLKIKNPEGFSKGDAFVLGAIDVQIDRESLAKDGPIVVNRIVIEAPQIGFEVNEANQSNLQILSDNIKKVLPVHARRSEADEALPKEQGRKIVVKELLVRDGMATISHALVSKDIEAKIPDFKVNNLGAARNGFTGQEMVGQILAIMTQNATMAAADGLMKRLVPSVDVGQDGMVPQDIEDRQKMLRGLFGR